MNDSIVTLARMRHDEMMRRADKGRLAASVRGGTPRATRKARIARRPVVRLAMAAARMRPTATGR